MPVELLSCSQAGTNSINAHHCHSCNRQQSCEGMGMVVVPVEEACTNISWRTEMSHAGRRQCIADLHPRASGS